MKIFIKRKAEKYLGFFYLLVILSFANKFILCKIQTQIVPHQLSLEDVSIYPPAASLYATNFTPVEPELLCSPPSLLDGKFCKITKIMDATQFCPKATSRVENGQCIKIEEVAPTIRCPESSHLEGKKCLLVDIIPPAVFCPRGYTKDNNSNSCVAQEVVKPKYTCPAGYSNKNGSITQCVKTIATPAAFHCPDGYVIQSYGASKMADCLLVELIKPEVVCPKGYLLKSPENVCVFISFGKVIMNCPVGFKRDGYDFCSKLHIKDAQKTCPEGSIYEKKEHKEDCIVIDSLPPTPVCKKDFVYKNNMCIRVIESEVINVCSNGYKLHGNQCVHTEVFAPEFVCRTKNNLHGNKCVEVIETPFIIRCPKGEPSDINSQTCIETQSIKPLEICPIGHSKRNSQCITTYTTRAEEICLNGQLEGNACISHITIPADVHCKEGVPTEGLTGCVSETIKTPQTLCSDGFKLHMDACYKSVEEEVDRTCPPGTSSNGKKCELTTIVPPILSCPKNFVLNQYGDCFTSEFAEQIVKCAEGMKFQQGSCFPTKLSIRQAQHSKGF